MACGDAGDRPQRRAVPPLGAVVLDVVVHEAEVVAQLDRRRARQGGLVRPGQRLVGEQAEERPESFAADAVLPVEAEVIAHLLVHRTRGLVLGLGDELEDGRFRVGDEGLDVRGRQHAKDDTSVQHVYRACATPRAERIYRMRRDPSAVRASISTRSGARSKPGVS